MDLILASASPRRREILEHIGADFRIIPAVGPENPPAGASGGETAIALSGAKAGEVAAAHPDSVVIGADTVVEVDGVLLGKPRDEQDAARMLRLLSGRSHHVYTGVTVIKDGRAVSRAEETTVVFRTLTEREIAAYIATGEPMDKAGAYGYQGYAGLFIERIEGDYFNVIGLPLCCLGRLLEQVGVSLL
ncbi:MAG: Maf family protein [Oscillospiraceae bacterium]|nr:Maf family protein [Oscillospiraceae bacterium]